MGTTATQPNLCFVMQFPVVRSRTTVQLKIHTPSTDEEAVRPVRPKLSTAQCSTVVIMRHGATDWNEEGRVQGGLDKSHLTKAGVRQACVAGAVLRHVGFDSVYVSPLSRARKTLELLVTTSGNVKLQRVRPETLSSLQELNVPWQGLKKSEILTSYYAEEYATYLRDPLSFSLNGFNPVGDVMNRASDVWETLRRSRGSCQLVISHNQMNRALLCAAVGLPGCLPMFRQSNCCFNVLLLSRDGGVKVRLINSTANSNEFSVHLRPRYGHVRVVLHKEGGCELLKSALQLDGESNKCSSVLLLGDATGQQLAEVPEGVKLTRMPSFGNVAVEQSEGDETLLDDALRLLEAIRLRYLNRTVVLVSRDSRTLSALLSVVIGTGPGHLNSFIFDNGGITVVDINGSEKVGTTTSFVECHNVGAFAKSGPVLGYTQPMYV